MSNMAKDTKLEATRGRTVEVLELMFGIRERG